MKLSIVTTLYKSEAYLVDFHRRVSLAAKNIYNNDDIQIIYVDDGSPDKSLEIAVGLAKDDSRVLVIQLSRNFGHHRAIMAGLFYAVGEEVFLIDSDLEEQPECLVDFKEYIDSSAADVVYGVQQSRSGGFFKRLTGMFFYNIFNCLSDSIKIPRNFCTVRLMKINYVKELLRFTERDFYFAPLTVLAGFRQLPIAIDKLSKKGTTYSLIARAHLFISSIFSYSTKPLYFIFYIGLLITTVSMIFMLMIFIKKYFFGVSADGWTSLFLSLWFLGGSIIFFIGICSIYISKIIIEVKARPSYIVRRIFGSNLP